MVCARCKMECDELQRLLLASGSTTVRLSLMPGRGRGLLAAKDIRQGEVLFREEEVLLRGPPQRRGAAACAGCNSGVLDSLVPCRGCGVVAVCRGGRCRGHGKEECSALSEMSRDLSVEQRSLLVSSCSEWLLIWRALALRSKEGRSWERFSQLQERTDALYGSTEDANRRRVVPLVTMLMPGEEAEEVLKVASRLDANAFRMGGAVDGGTKSRGVFALASMINHSCVANARVMLVR